MNERLNIRRLQTPETNERSSSPFDVKSEISNTDRDRIIKDTHNLSTMQGVAHRGMYIDSLFGMSILEPTNSFPVSMEMKKYEELNVPLGLEAAVVLKHYGLDPELSTEYRRAIDRTFIEMLDRGKRWDAIHVAALEHILSPERQIIPSADLIASAVNDMERISGMGPSTIERITSLGADLRILGQRIELPKQVWNSMKAELSEAKKAPLPRQMLSMAANMKILAAKEVRVTTRDLQLVIHEQAVAENIKPLPETSEL